MCKIFKKFKIKIKGEVGFSSDGLHVYGCVQGSLVTESDISKQSKQRVLLMPLEGSESNINVILKRNNIAELSNMEVKIQR